jgi:hypothetical protein
VRSGAAIRKPNFLTCTTTFCVLLGCVYTPPGVLDTALWADVVAVLELHFSHVNAQG